MIQKSFFHGLAFTALALTLSAPAASQDNNDKQPIRIVVGFAPGGSADSLARHFAEHLHAQLGNSFIVENRTGASAQIAAEFVARAKPDGKTILITSPSPVTVFPLIYKQLRYDPVTDFAPVAHLADVPLALSVKADSPIHSVQDYLETLKRDPDSAAIGLVALGSPSHFGVMTLGKSLKVALTPVAYRGVTPMLTDLIEGSLPAALDAVGGQISLYKAGKIRLLAVTGLQRSGLLKDIPTLKESGVDGFDMASGWFAAFVPAGTPASSIARLEAAFVKAAHDPALRNSLGEQGIELTGKPAAELNDFVQAQREYWKPIIEESGFNPAD